MDAYHILSKKLKGDELCKEEVSYFVDGVTNGSMADYQISAMLAAIYINGLTEQELFSLTELMAYSGTFVSLSDDPMLIDKHSTGGVGDKISFICAPMIAALGMKIGKMSGRGLGHTGGTIDKLEAIPNMRVDLTSGEFQDILDKVGCVISGQTGNFCPADKKMYALRDVTATVDSLPLIAASIMSKKIASGAPHIILDVKCGHGAFMKDISEASKLSELMLKIATSFDRKAVVLITDMNEPLGNCIGNALEVNEAVGVLKGKISGDLLEISAGIAGYAMILSGLEQDPQKAMAIAAEQVTNGKALEAFEQMIKNQNGDISFIKSEKGLPFCENEKFIYANKDGFVWDIDAEKIGTASMFLGAGREKKQDNLNYGAGIILNKKTGDSIKKGELMATMYYKDDKKLLQAEELVLNAYCIQSNKKEKSSKILKVMSNWDSA